MSIVLQTKFNRIPAITTSVRTLLSLVVRKTAFDIEADIKLEMAKPKTGRTYRKGTLYSIETRKATEFRTHQASAPGEAPAVDYGQLINSIQVRNVTDLTSTIGTNVRYAVPLEFGSRKIKPRPVWRPVVEAKEKVFIQAVRQVLSQLK